MMHIFVLIVSSEILFCLLFFFQADLNKRSETRLELESSSSLLFLQHATTNVVKVVNTTLMKSNAFLDDKYN